MRKPLLAGWFKERRLDYIDWRLLIYGSIRRADLMRVFSISIAQASHDLRDFRRLAPRAMWYDLSAKTYRPAARYSTLRGFTPSICYALNLLAQHGHPMGWD